MFSSLPSASKIYVNSSKSKPKSGTNARRKRKKSDAGSSLIENNAEDTLISRSHKYESRYQKSFQDNNSKVCNTSDIRSGLVKYEDRDLQFCDTVNGNIDTCEYDDFGTPSEENNFDFDINPSSNEIEVSEINSNDISSLNKEVQEICPQNVDNSLIKEIVNCSLTSEPDLIANDSMTCVELPLDDDKLISVGHSSLEVTISNTSDMISAKSICEKYNEVDTPNKIIFEDPPALEMCPKLDDTSNTLDEKGCAENLTSNTNMSNSEHCALKVLQTKPEIANYNSSERLISVDDSSISKPCNLKSSDIENNTTEEEKSQSSTDKEDTNTLNAISTSQHSLKASLKETNGVHKNQEDSDICSVSEQSSLCASDTKNDCVLKTSEDECLKKLPINNSENTNVKTPEIDSCDDGAGFSMHSAEITGCNNDVIGEDHATCNDRGNMSVSSEQDSCTESVICNLKEDSFDVSCDAIFNPLKQDFLEKNISLHSLNAKHLSSCVQSRSAGLLTLKRSVSLPDLLEAKNKDRNGYNINIGSNITLLNDKATITSDLTSSISEDACSFSSEGEKPARKKSDNKSVASGGDLPLNNILFPLAMTKVRMRNYVFGCKGLKGALLGNEELFRLFPQHKMTVFVGTWNMNGHDSPQNIDDFLLPLDVDSLPDIYAIGVQESMQSKSEWELLLQTTLGPSHVLFTSASLGVLHLAIFLRRDLIWFCSEPEEANIATRVGSMVKTKGAIAVCFMLFGTSLLFINSHLTAHEQNMGERISDYEKICSGLDLPRLIPVKTRYCKNVTSRFDCVFWCGDLNFRITWNRPAVLNYVEKRIKTSKKSCDTLIKHDQLHKAIKEGTVFQGFKEGIISFNPSFKFDVGTNTFDSTKQRVPSYTDRILYRCKDASSVTCLHYNCVPEITSSDHKPVFGIYEVSLKPGRDNVPLAAGIFKREVYLEALKRRANFFEVSRNQRQSAICNVM